MPSLVLLARRGWAGALDGGPVVVAASSRFSDSPIGGWLLVLFIGLGFWLLQLLSTVEYIVMEFFLSGTVGALIERGGESYHPLSAVSIAYELLVNAAFTAAIVLLLVFMFRRSPRFRSWFLVIIPLHLVAVVSSALLAHLADPTQPIINRSTLELAGPSFLWLITWVPYVYFSKRVRHVFSQASAV